MMYGSRYEEYTVEVELPPSCYLIMPQRVRERHMTEDNFRMGYEVQAMGTHLQALFRTERDTFVVRIPFEYWLTGRVYNRKLNDWSLYLNRWKNRFDSIREEEINGTLKQILEIEIIVLDDELFAGETEINNE